MQAHPNEMIEELIQEIVDDFDERGWLECEYRPDLTSEAACRAADQFALVTIWDEQVINGTLRYRTIINNEIIAKRLSDVVPPGTSAFEEIKRAISDRVEAVADARLRDDVMRLQRPPSQFCRSADTKAGSDTPSPEREVMNQMRQAFISWAYKEGHLIPRYRDDIATLQDIETCDDLPLLYAWSPSDAPDNISISLNGHLLSRHLETYLPRTAPEFQHTTAHLRQELIEISTNFLSKTAAETGLSIKEVIKQLNDAYKGIDHSNVTSK